MSEKKQRKAYSGEFKAKVGLEALRGVKTINEIAQEFGVHPVLVGQWKKEIQARAASLFDSAVRQQARPEAGGRTKLARAPVWRNRTAEDGIGLAQKKVWTGPVEARRGWIEFDGKLSIVRQCELAGVSRATVYARQQPKVDRADDLLLCRLIDEEYTRHPYYGSRRMAVYLRNQGYSVNRKRIQRLMRQLGLAGMAPGPNTSKPQPEHKVYPYLLRGVAVTRPNQVWGTDITYIRLPRGFAYLVAVMDWYSRKVLSWRISNSMDASFCVDCLEEALRQHGTPEIFNSDQGSQFTSHAFIDVLEQAGVAISMDGRGRCLDNIFVERLWRNVKYEDVYLKGYTNMQELMCGLTRYFVDYNEERPHQSLGYQTPNLVYSTSAGGGAMIVDRFSREEKAETGQRRSAASEERTIA